MSKIIQLMPTQNMKAIITTNTEIASIPVVALSLYDDGHIGYICVTDAGTPYDLVAPNGYLPGAVRVIVQKG